MAHSIPSGLNCCTACRRGDVMGISIGIQRIARTFVVESAAVMLVLPGAVSNMAANQSIVVRQAVVEDLPQIADFRWRLQTEDAANFDSLQRAAFVSAFVARKGRETAIPRSPTRCLWIFDQLLNHAGFSAAWDWLASSCRHHCMGERTRIRTAVSLAQR